MSFLFTDIEGSTRLVANLGPRYGSVLDTHHRILRAAISSFAGLELGTQGDSFFAVFRRPIDAVSAAIAAQRGLMAEQWPDGIVLRVRMGIHTGDATLGGDNYVGLTVHRAARIADAGYGSQVLLSAPTAAEVRDDLPEDVGLLDLGEHWLRDLEHPEPLTQLVIAGIPAEFPQLRGLGRPPTNLPAELTEFIGRRTELDLVAASLGASRLVTIVGTGGSGKTRLAVRAASELQRMGEHGVVFVPLETVEVGDRVYPAIAVAIGAHGDTSVGLSDELVAHLREKRTLLVLDNLEQVRGAEDVIAHLLSAAPQVQILGTSRVPLRIPGERTVPLSPFDAPDLSRLTDVVELAQVDSVALFVARARDVDPGFALTTDNASVIAEICARLDGLPLAIELAAARTRLLTPDAILSRLERPLAALGTRGSGPGRQRTLRAAIAWSYDLLEESERRLLRRISVATGLDIDAAAAIGGDGGGEVLDDLQSLVEKNLVRRIDRAAEPHFSMLLTIREFASERLAEDPDEERTARRLHARHWLDVVERLAGQVDTASDAALRLTDERENLRGALTFSLAPGAADDDRLIGRRLALALAPFWMHTSPRQGSEWLERALDPSEGSNPHLQMQIEFYAGALLEQQGRAADAEVRLTQALDRVRALGDQVWLSRVLNSLATVIREREGGQRARELLLESLAIRRELGDDPRLAVVLSNLAIVDIDQGDLDAARDHLRASIEVDRMYRNQDGIATGLVNLAEVELRSGNVAAAEGLIVESLRVFAHLGDLLGMAEGLAHAAEVAVERGGFARAARLLGASETIRSEEGLEIPDIEAERYGGLVARIRDAMTPDEYQAAYADGSRLPPRAAVEEALGGLTVDTVTPG